MTEKVTMSELLELEADSLLEDGEIYNLEVDGYEIKFSKAGNAMLMLNLVVLDGAKKDLEFKDRVMLPQSLAAQRVFKAQMKAFDLTFEEMITNLGVESDEDLGKLGDYLDGKRVRGRAKIDEFMGEKRNSVFFLPLDETDEDK